MPVIKSAKKRMRQNSKRRARNYSLRSEIKTVIKKFLLLVKDGKAEEAVKLMPKAYSVIDMAEKKNILHPNNASRKKSRLARELNILQQGGSANSPKSEEKSESKKTVKEDKKKDKPENTVKKDEE